MGISLAMAASFRPCPALDKPTGAPLELSSIETEQAVPLAFLDPDGKTAHCALIKLHWNPNSNVGPSDESTSFELDLPPANPSGSIFTAQLWNASLASAMAWQQPWQGARWKVLQTPTTDGTGIDAALAVGMIATSARRAYPENTVVIGSLNPDGSLGPVSHMIERMDAASAAGIKRVIIPTVQRFDTDAAGQVVNMMRHASDLHLDCEPVDNLVEATETVMNDPLPATAPSSSTPTYGNDVVSYIDDFAHREQVEATANLKFAPKETDLAKYPPRMGALWKSIYADYTAGQQAYRASQVYIAYQLFSRANGSMIGVNQLVGQSRASFDVRAALAESDDLRNHLHTVMNPPAIDQGELQSAVLVAEMSDWAYEINASLEGAQLVTKQTFSQRSDATESEKDRAREAILFAIEQAKYLLNQADFYTGLMAHIGKNNPIPVDQNAAHLLPQLIPAQLATAQIFTEGIRQRANDLRDGLLFDPRLAAYVNVLREAKATWDARLRKKDLAATEAAAAPTPAPTDTSTNQVTTPVKPNSNGSTEAVGFDPGNTYVPPHTALSSPTVQKKLSDAAQCLIWVNNDCEIATLDEKYLRLSGTVDPATHEWHVKDRAKLDALLQAAETGARQGIAFAEKAEVDPSLLAMIYERASHYRIQDDDAAALEALRNYWRCALLGNMCWQLAHARKAQPVDLTALATPPAAATDTKTTKGGDKKVDDKPVVPKVASTTKAAADAATAKLIGDTGSQAPPAATTNVVSQPAPPPAAPIVRPENHPTPPRALPVVEDTPPAPTPPAPPVHTAVPPAPTPTPAPTPVPAPATASDEANIPVAPIARVQDYTGGDSSPATNAPPANGPVQPSPKADNADGHANAFP